MRKFFVRLSMAVALLVGVAGAMPAQAGTVIVTFAIGGTVMTGGFGPLGAPGGGTMTVSFTTPSASQTTIVTGPVHVLTFAFAQVISLPAVPGALAGALSLTGGSLAGTFTAGGSLAIFGPLHVAAGFVHCLSTACAFLLGFPVSIPIPIASAPIGPISIFGPFAGGGPVVGISLAGPAGAFAGLPISLILGGTEISRVHVPEPGSMLYLGSSVLAALGLFGVTRRRR